MFKLSEGAAKIIHNETFKDVNVNVVCFGCAYPRSFFLAQQTWFSAPFGNLGSFIMQEWGFSDPYTQFSITISKKNH